MIQLWLSVVHLCCCFISEASKLSTCDIASELTTGTCAQFSKDLEKAVLNDDGNLYQLRRAFFYSPTAAPVLLKVVYNVTFSEYVIKPVMQLIALRP